MFNGLNSLTTFSVQYNKIQTIEAGCFSHLGNLLYLYLGLNKLESVSGDMWLGLHSLKDLDLADNNIKTLSENAFRLLPHTATNLLNLAMKFLDILFKLYFLWGQCNVTNDCVG